MDGARNIIGGITGECPFPWSMEGYLGRVKGEPIGVIQVGQKPEEIGAGPRACRTHRAPSKWEDWGK